MARTYITDDEFDEMVKMSKFYTKLKEESFQEGFREGIEQVRKENIERGKLLTIAQIIRSGAVSLEATTDRLRLTPAEIDAIQALLQQSSNGNGSNGAHE
jgi:predicted transposase YdaD